MSDKVLKQLKALRAQLRKWNDTLDHYQKLFEADGTIDAREQAQLKKLTDAIKKIEAKIEKKEDELNLRGTVINNVHGTSESVSDYLSSTDDIVDHSLVNGEQEEGRGEEDTGGCTPNPDTSTDDTPDTPTDNTPDTPDTPTDDTPDTPETPTDNDTATVSSGISAIIQGGESGAAGYNAYNRGTQGNRILGPNGDRSLVSMTLAKIMADQKRPKSDPQTLFAVGKYQMIPTTLKEGVAALNIDHSTKFNATTQEYLFSDYLLGRKRPAIRAYIQGTGTAQAAQIAGAKEWASIADPRTNKSYYDGSGGNSAHITAADFLATLDESKEEYKKNIAAGMDPDAAYRKAVAGVQGDDSNSEPDTGNTDSGSADSGSTDSGNTFEVPSGWGLNKISAEKGVSVEDLKAWNADKLKTYRNGSQGFNVGETIVIKNGSSSGGGAETTFEVPSGWGLNKIASEKGVTVEQLKSWNADKLKTYRNGSQGFNAGETIIIKGGGSVNTDTTNDGGTSDGGSDDGDGEVTSGGHIKPAWIREAEKHMGKKETARMVKDDPWVKLLFEELGAYGWAKDHTVSAANWCAAFVSYCLKKTGKSPLTGFDGMRAQTYADKYGTEITRPAYGAIAVVKRSGGGHIGFVVGYNKANGAIQLLGGNQGGEQVCIITETRDLVAYKIPSGWKVPEQNYLD